MVKNYSSRAATFTAPEGISHRRQVTGLDGPSASAAFAPAFPQPDDAEDEDSEYPEEDAEAENSNVNQEEEDQISQLESEATPAQDGGGKASSMHRIRNPLHRKTQRRKNGSSYDKPKSAPSFITARTKQKTSRTRLASTESGTRRPAPSFSTAQETPASTRDARKLEVIRSEAEPETPSESNQTRSFNGDASNQATAGNSTTALLPSNDGDNDRAFNLQNQGSSDDQPKVSVTGLVKFNTGNKPERADSHPFSKITSVDRRRSWRRLRQGQKHPGEIVKMEKMLVRVDSTVHELSPDYDENESLKIEARTVEKWREFVVVCRESTDQESDFSIQMYKTRVIPATEETHVAGRSTYEIPLIHKSTHVNLYSSLDKTLVMWVPGKRGTMIYILRTRSTASAAEWYTFIRESLGWKRATVLNVNVPDLSVTIQLENPFGDLEESITAARATKSENAAMKTMEAEKAIASSIIQKSLKMLENNPEWADVLDTWLAKEKIGLAWRRFDRLEWVHGANEQKMYGTLAMQRTHELELRPKNHYPTHVWADKEIVTEPAPVEGFLIRLTSQKGNVRRLGKMYFKRLYFTTHNQYLCYCRPAKALPPPPPHLPGSNDSKVPSAGELVKSVPLVFAVNPFPERDGHIDWLSQNSASRSQHDEDSFKESERKINSLLQAEGYINLIHVLRVQNVQKGNSVADDQVEQGSDVDFHEEVDDSRQDDGKTQTFDEKRTFELVMKNKLVVRLQAYNEDTKREWIHRLRKLVQYWKLRLVEDVELLKSTRTQNLKCLAIDEEIEAYLGQFASKWEVTRSFASPRIFHMCGISCCRAITKAGTLYRKPKRHSTFLRCGVILCHGRLLVFHGTLRKRSGMELRHIQHNRLSSVDLSNCYIYSGLLTEGDLLYQNQTFDSNNPGNHALPRLYLEDSWTSTDEDPMTCFVIWQPRNKSWFKASEEQDAGRARTKLRHVSRLGVPGRCIVFKTRSRTERDQWVTSIGVEIDRLRGGEDIRVVNQ